MKHSHLIHYNNIIEVHHHTRQNFRPWLHSKWHWRIPRTVILKVNRSFVVAHSSLLPVCECTVEGIARSHLSIPFDVFHGADSWFPNYTLAPLSFSNAPVHTLKILDVTQIQYCTCIHHFTLHTQLLIGKHKMFFQTIGLPVMMTSVTALCKVYETIVGVQKVPQPYDEM